MLQENRDQAAIHKQDTGEFMTERLQWEEEKASLLQENRDQAAIHKQDTGEFMTKRLQWEEEKATLLQENRDSCVAQLNQKEEVDNFAAVLRNAEQHFKGFEEWREEMSSLIRAVEELKQMLQKKEQESVSKDFLAVKTQLEDLQRKVNEKKRNKWYRFCGTLFTPRRAE
ncbi:hypothetical protein VZT92_012722 [Zoarces viviparus]|uniref:Uncharacterized protein n=1 Tax=Zoarces viviparus TaxID=48416 RepID=A0AAW1F0R9_ZOAVI